MDAMTALETMQTALADAKTEAVKLRRENDLLRDAGEEARMEAADRQDEAEALRDENHLLRHAGELVLLGLIRDRVCLLCAAPANGDHRALCPAAALADVLAER